MRVIIQGNWAPYIGTDYCEALGTYDNLKDAEGDALSRAWDTWEGQEEYEEEENFSDEGPDYWIEEYDPEIHDMLYPGGGRSFEDDFRAMEKHGLKG